MRIVHPTRASIGMPEGGPILEVNELCVDYGRIRALKGVTLRVHPGEIVAMIGANGAGKTTTLKTICRLLPISSGTLRFRGADIGNTTTEALVESGVSLVPEGRGIFPNLTVRENLELGAYSHRHQRSIDETFEDVTALFPRLRERMTQVGGTLSGGEQQMLAIGRALMARPSLLLLDEPSLGIAPKLVAQIFEAIVAIAKSGMTILLVEQNTHLALRVSQRAYVLRTGTVALEGRSDELAKNPEIQALYLGG